METRNYADKIAAALNPAADKKNALAAKAYLRDQFSFLGIQTPQRRKILAAFIRQHGLLPKTDLHALMQLLWNKPEREFHYCALEIALKYKNKFDQNDLALFERLIVTNAWWDTVDVLAPKLCAAYFSIYPDQLQAVTQKWIASGNIWLIRSAIIVQLGAKEKTNESVLFSTIKAAATHPDFFVRKGIGWALRQHARINPKAVKKFVANTTLSPLSEREALKHLG
jgi:3-methyladenine DNA glycosylase AlkD